MSVTTRLIHVWSASALRDLRNWMVSGRLPPNVVLEDLVPIVDSDALDRARLNQRIEDLESEVDHLQDELSAVEFDRDEWQEKYENR